MSNNDSNKETIESLKEVEKALEVVQGFAERHWMPCLRDCCGDGLGEVEDMLKNLEDK